MKELLIKKIAECLLIDEYVASEVFFLLFNTISSTLKQEDRVILHGFGSFAVKKRKACCTINPLNGKKITVPPCRKIYFRSSGHISKSPTTSD